MASRAGVHGVELPLLAVPMSEPQFAVVPGAVGEERIALGIEDHGIPLAGFIVEVQRADQPRIVLQDGVADVQIVRSGAGELVPGQVGNALPGYDDRAGVSDFAAILGNLNGPPLLAVKTGIFNASERVV